MAKLKAIGRFLLSCVHRVEAPVSPPSPATTKTKKRLITSLRDDSIDLRPSISQQDHESSSSSSSSLTPTTAALSVPPRSSRTMVFGTIFGYRGGRHMWFCVQHDRFSTKPSLLLELSIPISALNQEMKCGPVRISLEVNVGDQTEAMLRTCPLHSVPLWTLYCNGRKLGFAVKRKATQHNKNMLKTMRNITVGAGVIPCEPGLESGPGQKEVLYMRANFECVVGNADSESFHLINPEEDPSHELSIFLMRLK